MALQLAMLNSLAVVSEAAAMVSGHYHHDVYLIGLYKIIYRLSKRTL